MPAAFHAYWVGAPEMITLVTGTSVVGGGVGVGTGVGVAEPSEAKFAVANMMAGLAGSPNVTGLLVNTEEYPLNVQFTKEEPVFALALRVMLLAATS